MKHILQITIVAFLISVFIACSSKTNNTIEYTGKQFSELLNKYYEDRIKLFPLESTSNGDNRYNDLLPNNLTIAFRNEEKLFFQSTLDSLNKFDRSKLSYNEQISFDVLQWELQINLEGLKFHDELMPMNQFWSLTLTMGQLGSGSGIQPFKTVKDYDNFLSRITAFVPWCDTAIANMRRGIAQGYVLPKVLVERMIPQAKSMITVDATNNLFYTPVTNFPANFSETDKSRLKEAYAKAVNEEIVPSYLKLFNFFSNEYLPVAKTSSGISSIPYGKEYYSYLVKQWTTTNMSPDEVFDLGQKEVARIKTEMEKIKNLTSFKGDLKSFFEYVRTDPQFYPFKTDSDVIHGFQKIYAAEITQVNKLFTTQPKTRFEIRETEKFRAASASAEYQQGSGDGSRPGIFYVPIVDATRFTYVGMETLFLHEAIPGHHFQISLQQENNTIPTFRKFIWYGAYGEGWALYAESLGEQLGLYTNPYEKLGNLSEEMHRAVRLVVDVGLHVKGWTREQAIDYSLDNEAESEEAITTEIERYMAIPGQALGYKIGQLKIIELRTKAQKVLGDKFNYGDFHEEILKNGCLPLAVLESDFNIWLEREKAL